MKNVQAVVKVFDSNGVCCGIETVSYENADWIIEDGCLTIVRTVHHPSTPAGPGFETKDRLVSYPASDWKLCAWAQGRRSAGRQRDRNGG